MLRPFPREEGSRGGTHAKEGDLDEAWQEKLYSVRRGGTWLTTRKKGSGYDGEYKFAALVAASDFNSRVEKLSMYFEEQIEQQARVFTERIETLDNVFNEQVEKQANAFNEMLEKQASMFNERISALEARLAHTNMERLVSEVLVRKEIQKKEQEILTLKACLPGATLGIGDEGMPRMDMGADVAAQDLGAVVEGPGDQTFIYCSEVPNPESNTAGVGPQYIPLTPRAATSAGEEVLMAKCYVSNITAFKKPSGDVVLVNHLSIGDEVLSHDGMAIKVAEIGQHNPSDKFPFALVLISTEQGSFKLSAGCRLTVAVAGQASQTIKMANRLRQGDSVMVGARWKRITRVQDCFERAELVWIRFEPDVSVETFQVSSHGIHTHGEETSPISSHDASWMTVVPSSVLARGTRGSFSDSE